MLKPEGNQPSISSFFNVPFNIVHEDWSIYSLEDGNKLRTRVVLVSLKSSQLPIKKGVTINSEYQVIVSYSSLKLRSLLLASPPPMSGVSSGRNDWLADNSLKYSDLPSASMFLEAFKSAFSS